MIFRALFWIGLVSLLAPREPDIGLGHPDAGTSPSLSAAFLSAAHGLSRTDGTCGQACAGGLGLATRLLHLDGHSSLAAGLADVKAQIEADQRARALKAAAI